MDPTTCQCNACSSHVGAYNRHVRVSPTLTLNVRYLNTLPGYQPNDGNVGLAVEMDGEIIPQMRRLFRGNFPVGLTPDGLTPRQQAIVDLLWDALDKSTVHTDRCEIPGGDKTRLGLARTIERIFDNNPE